MSAGSEPNVTVDSVALRKPRQRELLEKRLHFTSSGQAAASNAERKSPTAIGEGPLLSLVLLWAAGPQAAQVRDRTRIASVRCFEFSMCMGRPPTNRIQT